ncbi:MAG: hypothetical protein ACMG6E_04375 [Candidatus Roizmanbacteria bacterium]
MDVYNRDWKQTIYGDRQLEDEEGFKYRYVPKDSIISEEHISPSQIKKQQQNGSGRGNARKNSKHYD